jgi:hypothetical protein
MEEKWAALEKCVVEMMDESLHIEEREFAMARALSILNSIKDYYIGGNRNESGRIV